MGPGGRGVEVARGKKKKRLMKKRLRADPIQAAPRAKKTELSEMAPRGREVEVALRADPIQAAELRAKERELLMRVREHDQWLGRFLRGEILAATFLELEKDGAMNLVHQKAMMEAIAEYLNDFGAGHGNNGAGFAAGI